MVRSHLPPLQLLEITPTPLPWKKIYRDRPPPWNPAIRIKSPHCINLHCFGILLLLLYVDSLDVSLAYFDIFRLENTITGGNFVIFTNFMLFREYLPRKRFKIFNLWKFRRKFVWNVDLHTVLFLVFFFIIKVEFPAFVQAAYLLKFFTFTNLRKYNQQILRILGFERVF